MEQTEIMTEITEEIKETEEIEESEELEKNETQTNAQNDTENEETEETETESQTETETETEAETEAENETESETELEAETETKTESKIAYNKILSLINEINEDDGEVAIDSEYQETVLQCLDNIQTYQQNIHSTNVCIAFFTAFIGGVLVAYVVWSRMR